MGERTVEDRDPAWSNIQKTLGIMVVKYVWGYLRAFTFYRMCPGPLASSKGSELWAPGLRVPCDTYSKFGAHIRAP